MIQRLGQAVNISTGKISNQRYFIVFGLAVIFFLLLQPLNVKNICHQHGKLSDWVIPFLYGESFVQIAWLISNTLKYLNSESSKATLFGNTTQIYLPPAIVNILALIATFQQLNGNTRYCKDPFG